MIVNYFVRRVNEKGEFQELPLKAQEQSDIRQGDEFIHDGEWLKIINLEFMEEPNREILKATCLKINRNATNKEKEDQLLLDSY